jgi:hypothetical protein
MANLNVYASTSPTNADRSIVASTTSALANDVSVVATGVAPVQATDLLFNSGARWAPAANYTSEDSREAGLPEVSADNLLGPSLGHAMHKLAVDAVFAQVD